MDESTHKWVKLEVLDWKSGWTKSYRFERVQGELFRKTKEVFDQAGTLISSKSKELELDVDDSDYLLQWEFTGYLRTNTRKKFVSYTLEGDSGSIEHFLNTTSWKVKKVQRPKDSSSEYKYRGEVAHQSAELEFDSNPKTSWTINGADYLALKVFSRGSYVREHLFSAEQIKSLLSKSVFALTKTGGSWKDWKFSVYSAESPDGKSLAYFELDRTRIYFELEGNVPEVAAKAFRYQLEAFFRELWSEGVKHIPTDGWARWIVEQYLIHDFGDFKMLDDEFKFELNMTEDELQAFRTQMFEPWKFPQNNTQYEITGEY